MGKLAKASTRKEGRAATAAVVVIKPWHFSF